jgi:hypothetical protein
LDLENRHRYALSCKSHLMNKISYYKRMIKDVC